MCKQEQNATKNLTKTRQAGLTRPRVMSCNTPTTQHSSCGGREREYRERCVPVVGGVASAGQPMVNAS